MQKHIIKQLEELSDSDLVQMHNSMCEVNNYPDDRIYENDEFFYEEYFSDKDSLLRAALYGDFRYNDVYVIFNGYANLESFDNPAEHTDIPTIADCIEENPYEDWGDLEVDAWEYIEANYSDWHSCNDVAEMDVIQRYLDDEYDPEDPEDSVTEYLSNTWGEDFTREDLEARQQEIMEQLIELC